MVVFVILGDSNNIRARNIIKVTTLHFNPVTFPHPHFRMCVQLQSISRVTSIAYRIMPHRVWGMFNLTVISQNLSVREFDPSVTGRSAPVEFLCATRLGATLNYSQIRHKKNTKPLVIYQ